jgi:hypothetical protein
MAELEQACDEAVDIDVVGWWMSLIEDQDAALMDRYVDVSPGLLQPKICRT